MRRTGVASSSAVAPFAGKASHGKLTVVGEVPNSRESACRRHPTNRVARWADVIAKPCDVAAVLGAPCANQDHLGGRRAVRANDPIRQQGCEWSLYMRAH